MFPLGIELNQGTVPTPLQLRVYPHRRIRRHPRRRVQRVAMRRLHLPRVGRDSRVPLHSQGGRRRRDRRLQCQGDEEKGRAELIFVTISYIIDLLLNLLVFGCKIASAGNLKSPDQRVGMARERNVYPTAPE